MITSPPANWMSASSAGYLVRRERRGTASIIRNGAGVKLRGQGAPMASFQDVNGDGRQDMVVHVITEMLNLSETDTQAVLAGQTFSEAWILGADTIRAVR